MIIFDLGINSLSIDFKAKQMLTEEIQLKEDERRWYAAYTRSRSEKKACLDLIQLGLEAYVPLQKKIRIWSDRKKVVEFPIIPSYVFIKILPAWRDKVFKSPNVVRYIYFNGEPAAIPEKQILILKQLVNAEVPVESTIKSFLPGDAVKVIFGPLLGMEGEFVDVGREKCFLIRISNIGYSLLIRVPAAWVEKR